MFGIIRRKKMMLNHAFSHASIVAGSSTNCAVEYSLTPLGQSLKKILEELLKWGNHLRKEVVGK